MIEWEVPGYVVAFTTRTGGVSVGVYESLNLGVSTGDDPSLVGENRRRACERLGLEAGALVHNRQVHSPVVHRARGGELGRPGDGLWSDEPRLPLLAVTADCLPIVLVRRSWPRALAVLHAGWRGLASGLVATGAAALGGENLAAVVGPAIGPCCYEVGDEVSSLFDDDLTVSGRLDLPAAGERALRRAGVESVERIGHCTCCTPELFFSHRRSGFERGVQGVIGAVAG